MCGANHHALHRGHLEPAAGGPTTGEHERIYVISFDDGKLEIPVERSRRYFLPNQLVVHCIESLAANLLREKKAELPLHRSPFSRGRLVGAKA